MSDVHESLTDWRTLPANILAGHRAIVQLDEGTIIDGYLEHVPSKLRKELRGATEGIRESLTIEGVYQPVIISVNAGEKHLANGVKAVNISQGDERMSLTEVCWNISSVFIVIVLGVMAVLAMLTLFAIVAAIFTSNPQDKEEHHGNERE